MIRVIAAFLLLFAASAVAQQSSGTVDNAGQSNETAGGDAPAEPAETVEAAPPTVQPVVTAELTPETAAVGQPLVLRVSILVPTWLPTPPTFPSIEAPNLIVRLPEGASGPISERVEGETWSGVSRAYRLYPMVPGDFSLPAQTISITYADPDTTQPVKYDATLAPVRFTATVPEGAEGLDPLILGAGFTLEQSFEGSEGTLAQGDAVSRTVTAKITGTSALFIPPLIPELQADAVQAYAKDPVVQETEDRGALAGSRVETVTYVAQYGGEVDLPAISLDWFNTETNAVETAQIDGMTLTVEAPAAPVEPKVTRRQIAMLLGGALGLALLVWAVLRYVVPPVRRYRAARHAEWLASEAFAAKQVEAALSRKDLSAVLNALALWSMRCPGDETALDTALAGVGAGRFGKGGINGGDGWPALSTAFGAERKRRNAANSGRALALPPLNPT